MWSAAAATEADATVICAPGDGVPPSVLLSTPQAQYLFNVPEGARPSPPLPHAPLSVHTLSNVGRYQTLRSGGGWVGLNE
jgi:hypothetical protein